MTAIRLKNPLKPFLYFLPVYDLLVQYQKPFLYIRLTFGVIIFL